DAGDSGAGGQIAALGTAVPDKALAQPQRTQGRAIALATSLPTAGLALQELAASRVSQRAGRGLPKSAACLPWRACSLDHTSSPTRASPRGWPLHYFTPVQEPHCSAALRSGATRG